MNKGLIFLSFLMGVSISILLFPNGAVGALIAALGFSITVWLIKLAVKDQETFNFLTNIFIAALLIRLFLASLIYGLSLENNFGPDAITYNSWGVRLLNFWFYNGPDPGSDFSRIGWGMAYIVSGIYLISGENPFAVQVLSCILGAGTTILAFFTSKEIFYNNRVARYAAIFVAFFPAMIIWTSQLLKEGFIIFCLVLGVLATLNLLKKLSYGWVACLLISLLALSGLRFYIFFMMIVAIFGGFVLTSKSSAQSLVSRFIACVVIGLAFAYIGVWQVSSDQLEKYGSLERVKITREWSSREANSGIIKDDYDVTTTEGLISALPIGLATLFLAPFPWQVGSLTQGLTMPEMIIWWASLPFLISGLLYTIRYRFRESVSILFFTLILSLSYAIIQGNLGTIYRQRAQIQVFLLLFTAVGFALRMERRENLNHQLKSFHNRLPHRIPVK
jgi:hypothetical protein